MNISVEHDFVFIETNGITLHVLKAGNPSNPLAILLHGFPEFWRGWENQVDDLVEAGYFVMVPDQRGYNLSDKPRGVGAYRTDKLAQDIVGLIDHAGKQKASIAGHDWGAAVAWYLGMEFGDRVEKLVIVNVPHTSVMRKTLTKDREQRKKSMYMFQFQFPLLPQWLLRRKNYRMLENALVKTANKGTFGDMSAYKNAWSQKRAIPCMLNWYRAAVRRRVPNPNKKVKVPTLIIWGENDAFLKSEMARESLEYCANGQLEYISDATHWVLHEKPDEVNLLIRDFFNS